MKSFSRIPDVLKQLFLSRKTWVAILVTGLAVAAYARGNITAEQLADAVTALVALVMIAIGVIDGFGKVPSDLIPDNPLLLLISRKFWIGVIGVVANTVLFFQGGTSSAHLIDAIFTLAVVLISTMTVESAAQARVDASLFTQDK